MCGYCQQLAFGEVTVMLDSSVIFEDDEDMEESLLMKLNCCPAGGVVGGTVLYVEDATQNVCLTVHHCGVAVDLIDVMSTQISQ